jgi:Restriction endonuclease AspBHI N-terminal/Restriction endonuclease
VTSSLINPGEPFETHEIADLVVDRAYLGGPQPNWAADPLARLLPVGLQGGIRVSRGKHGPSLVALATSGANADWPDSVDTATGTVTYYGDNRHPGSELHDTPKHGNRVLRATFDWAHTDADTRRNVPPYFLFAKAGPGRDIVFRGVLAPGAPELTADEDLVAVWRSQHGLRFQNYRAQFTILDIATATRAWICDILAGDPLSANCPGPWRRWITGRHYQALTATRIEYRSKSEQLPSDAAGHEIIACIRAHFASRPSRFEAFAAHLWQMADGNVGSYEVTRASVDGGRDAVGEYRIGPAADPVAVTFALEAKLYDPAGGGVGVSDVARLISRLRHRQFGVLVTTSYVARQAYQEVRADQHPVVILAAGDIVSLLRAKGYPTQAAVSQWLTEAFPYT